MKLEPIHVVIGDAAFLVDREADAIEAEAVARCGLPQFNHGVWHASDPSAEQAVITARTMPMMADLRVVALRHVEEASVELMEALTAYAAAPSVSTVLVVRGEKLPGSAAKGQPDWGRRFSNAAAKVGVVRKLSRRDASPQRVATEAAARHGKRLGSREARLLLEVVGEDLGRLVNEVGKLCLYVGERTEITTDDVALACSAVAEAAVWDLTSAVAQRNAGAALEALHRLTSAGDSSHRLLALITWQLRDLLTVSDMIRRGASDGHIRGKVRVRPDVVRRLRAQGDRAPRPAEVLERLARANRDMNQLRAGDQRVLESLVLDLVADG